MLLTGKDEIVPRGELRENLQHLESPADAQTVEIAGPHARGHRAVDADLASVRLILAEDAIE